MNATYTLNAEHNGIEITFDGKPEASILEALKAIGYRWHKAKKLWYAKQNPDTLALAQSLADGATVTTEPDSTPAKKSAVNTPESHKAYIEAVNDIWPNSPEMRDYCLKKVGYTALLPNGILFTIDKQSIDKDFCFGYSTDYSGHEASDARKQAEHARNSEDYFIRQNMKGFDGTLKDIDELNKPNGVATFAIMRRSYHGNAPQLYHFFIVHYREIENALGSLDSYRPGESIGDYYIPTAEDLAIIREAYQTARDEHEKKVRAYLKRYGLSKVHTWTYWLDE